MKLKLFDRFVQLVPVLIPFMACVGVVAELVPAYGELDTRFALVLSVILAVYMLNRCNANHTKDSATHRPVLNRHRFRLSSLSRSAKIIRIQPGSTILTHF